MHLWRKAQQSYSPNASGGSDRRPRVEDEPGRTLYRAPKRESCVLTEMSLSRRGVACRHKHITGLNAEHRMVSIARYR